MLGDYSKYKAVVIYENKHSVYKTKLNGDQVLMHNSLSKENNKHTKD
jgi:hypothetical protein